MFVKRHVSQLRGLKVGGQPLLIAAPKPGAQQRRADPVSLPDRVDPDGQQIPMRLFARVDADRHGLKLRDVDEPTAEGPQVPGKRGYFGPESGTGWEPD